MRIALLTLLTFGLLLCAGCAKKGVSLPGETPVYTISCDNTLDDCHVGARTLCNGPYTLETGSETQDKKTAPGSFGWVDAAGQQQDAGTSGGKYAIRIRCK
jgi:hypothetical protein